ncbi:4a-hydroxytetrahydrobiopterin dehydratase [Janibacter limosus]|uniref:4a-hydroxytetrahydrobiopterin dehydratase n=1 Tax=Janibacter limosus TaxID=53458 RepID=UPI0035DAC882|nr:4a-hydroxytetrahydrobiopterin dehydratase [Janibacter limosus]
MSDDAEVLTSSRVDERAPRDWREVDGMLRTRLKVADYAAALDPVNRIAKAADEADHHPDIDLRYNWVGLRLVSHDVGGISPRDPELAGQISRIAADPGAEPVPEVVTSMTVGIDTADADAIRPFWMALTGHGEAKGDASSLPSPDGQLPQIWFRESEAREGRGRVHLDVYVPHDRALARVEAVVAAGGRLVTDEFAPSWWVLADADGNEACVCTRQPHDQSAHPTA